MDTLGRVAPAGRALLARVDAVLSLAGAPPDHAIWPLLRRVGALPGDALEFVLALDVEALRAVGFELHTNLRRFAASGADLARDIEAVAPATPGGVPGWQGAAADAFRARWVGLRQHLGVAGAPDEPSLTGRLARTVSYVDALADWMGRLRAETARAIVDVLDSAEAVTVHATASGSGDAAAALRRAAAAATLGARVLAPVAEGLRHGDDLCAGWAGRLDELPFHPLAAPPAGGPSVLRAPLGD